ncbi:MAG: dihydrofolate reductase [Deltaproteobacteria bacterium]|nr:dihydrofolate reductase [Deltaproteobacteria bacterium]
MRISIIVAVADNGVIGRAGDLPWRLPADLKRFRAITMGKPVIVGRTTYLSLKKPLDGRTTVVVTDREVAAPGCALVGSIDEALAAAAASGAEEVMIAGGAQIYRQFIDRADRIYLTCVHTAVDGDVKFPVFDPADWIEQSREERPADEKNTHPLTFVVLERRRR